ncbi:MAG: hypothetical protein JW891_03600 [Candidatus Lokiarchaeota archaeon]|nr:hypothetical protein [Candidatus Lokiarchaeota archaeon]
MKIPTERTHFSTHQDLKNNDKFCSNPRILESRGYNVCVNCGTVHSRVIEKKPRVAFTSLEKKSRQINEKVYLPIGPRTVITGNKDINGNYLTPQTRTDFTRLAKINRGLVNGYERNLWIAIEAYNRLKSLITIPNHVEKDIFIIYKYAAKRKMTRGRGIEAILSASIFCAFRINGIPLILDEIIEMINISRREFLSSFKLLYEKVLPLLNYRVMSMDPIRYIDKLAEELRLSMKCRHVAVEMIESGENRGLVTSGKDPKGIAAASLYLSAKLCEEPRFQKEICKLAHITEVTMRARMQELMQLYPVLVKG